MCFVSAGEPRGTEGNLARARPVSYHIEVRTLYAEACLGKKQKCWPIWDSGPSRQAQNTPMGCGNVFLLADTFLKKCVFGETCSTNMCYLV